MFYANVLIYGIGLDPKSSPTRNMALTICIPSSTKKQGLFFYIYCIHKSQKGKYFKNLATK